MGILQSIKIMPYRCFLEAYKASSPFLDVSIRLSRLGSIELRITRRAIRLNGSSSTIKIRAYCWWSSVIYIGMLSNSIKSAMDGELNYLSVSSYSSSKFFLAGALTSVIYLLILLDDSIANSKGFLYTLNLLLYSLFGLRFLFIPL